ncbi:flagellar hook-associated protein FlgL [Cohnella fermenti]|uniref:Flagellar hook-associated protein 3 n=1 Tax=Cohnella fermenti TaxID=2565925 RepID=A0A4S4BZQ2_9BACL|nr:flagellar hook-associated protein FlgL [Cohnella fermenti]THF80808.1 flagellar hook-associated protein 3 [Cohnella fermenti]
MRVTGNMQYTSLLSNLRSTTTDIYDWQNKLSSGQKINKPSDDPVGISYVMRYDTELSRSDRYLTNAQTGSGILNTMDSVMQQADDLLKRTHTLTLQAQNDTMTDEERKTIAAEIKQIREQMVLLGNSTYNGRYLFNGQKTDQKPYSNENAANETTDSGVYQLNVSSLVQVPVSISGEKIFGEAGSDSNVFKVLDDLIGHLENGESESLGDDVTKILSASDNFSLQRAEIGARTNRFTLMEDRISDNIVNLKSLRSETTDVDYAEAITSLKLKQNVYQAALSTGSQIMSVSLIDFMR